MIIYLIVQGELMQGYEVLKAFRNEEKAIDYLKSYAKEHQFIKEVKDVEDNTLFRFESLYGGDYVEVFPIETE